MGNGCMRGKAVEVTSPTLPAFKIVVVGDSGSGKTSIIRRFVENRFDENYSRTSDVDITSVVKKLNVPEHAIVTVELWDVPGQNDIDLRKTYYLDVDAVIVVVDISCEDSLNVAGSWRLDVSNHARVSRTFTESVPNPDGKTFAKKIRKEFLKPKPGSVPVLLLGNKYDLAKSKFMKELEEAEKQETDKPGFPEEETPPDETPKTEVSNDDVPMTENESAKNLQDSKHNSKDESAVLESPDLSEKKETDGSNKNISKEDTTPDKPMVPENGHIENGDVPKANEDAKNTMKKIHPKDEKNIVTANGETKKLLQISTPEDAKSSVTMATSLVSILPPCVEEIERIAEKYGFVAGVPVSAKTFNGGVQEAIQSVLRRLMAKKLFNLDVKEAILERKNKNFDLASTRSMKSSTSKVSRKSKKKLTETFEPLQEVGIIEIDEVIRRCNPSLHDAEDLTAGFVEAIQGFKMVCNKNGFIPTTRVSLEVCITALKQAVESNFDPSNSDPRENIRLMLMTPEIQAERQKAALSLIVEDKEGFPDLRIVNSEQKDVEELKATTENPEEKIEIESKILKVLSEYREQFLQKSVLLLKHGDEVEAVLGLRVVELSAKEEKAWETAVAAGLSHEEVRRILSTIAQDKARLRGTAELVREARKSAQTTSGKIKATMLF